MKQNCVQCGKEFILTPAQIELYRSKKLQPPKRCRECRMKNREKTGKVNGVRDYSTSNVVLEEISETPFNKKSPAFFLSLLGAILVLTIGAIGGVKGYDYYLDNYAYNEAENYPDMYNQPEADGPNRNMISGIGEDETRKQEETTEPELEENAESGESGTEETEAVKERSPQENLQEAMIEKVTTTEDPFAEDEADKVRTYTFKTKALKQEHYDKHGIDMGFESADAYEQAASAVVTNPAALHKTEAEDGDDVYYIEATNEFVIVSRRGFIRTYFLPDAGKAYYERQ